MVWPLDLAAYDRSPLTVEEIAALTSIGDERRAWRISAAPQWAAVARLLQPLADARSALHPKGQRQQRIADRAVSELLADTLRQRRAVWEWSPAVWVKVLGRDQRSFFAAHPRQGYGELRQDMIAIAYLLRCLDDLPRLGHFERVTLARKVFGEGRITPAVSAVEEVLVGWGYADHGAGRGIRRALCDALLAAHSPVLADLTDDLLEGLRPRYSPGARASLHQVRRALAALGFVPPPARPLAPIADAEWRRPRMEYLGTSLGGDIDAGTGDAATRAWDAFEGGSLAQSGASRCPGAEPVDPNDVCGRGRRHRSHARRRSRRPP